MPRGAPDGPRRRLGRQGYPGPRLMVFRLDSRHGGFAEEFETLLNSKREVSEEVGLAVSTILMDVRARGDEAVLAHTDRFDKLPLTASRLAFTQAEIDSASAAISGEVLAAAKIAGVTEIYRIGGAQAIGALAYGTETIKPVSKIVGPGNAYVAAAKRQVFGTVGIDMIAGPSEVLVIADSSANPAWIAADLLAQAEHGGGAQSILVTTDAALADSVAIEVD